MKWCCKPAKRLTSCPPAWDFHLRWLCGLIHWRCLQGESPGACRGRQRRSHFSVCSVLNEWQLWCNMWNNKCKLVGSHRLENGWHDLKIIYSLLHRSKENNSPFKVASFDKEEEEENEECVKDELDVSSLDSLSQETSDYHSATSSDCGSASSSDTEEEAKDGDVQGEKEKEGQVAEKGKMEDESCKITMVPRIRKPHEDGSNRVKYPRNMVRFSCFLFFLFSFLFF